MLKTVESLPLLGTQNAEYSQIMWTHTIGKRSYELQNHLGNVLSVVSDKPLPHDDDSDGVIDWYLADIKQSTDYSPFGVELSGRTLTASGAKDFRYGFQNQEEDDEIKGEGNSLNYKYRMNDPRLGRFFAVDPMSDRFPWNSPYAFSENRVLDCIELEGLETKNVHYYNMEKQPDGTYKEGEKPEYSSSTLVIKATEVTFKNSITKKETDLSKGSYGEQSVTTNVYTYFNEDGTIDRQVVVSKQAPKAPSSSVAQKTVPCFPGAPTMPQGTPATNSGTPEGYEVVPGSTKKVESEDNSYAAVVIAPTLRNPFSKSGIGAVAVGVVLTYVYLTQEESNAIIQEIRKVSDEEASEYGSESEHTSNARNSTKGKHQRGQTRKARDKGGEKGDARRTRYK